MNFMFCVRVRVASRDEVETCAGGQSHRMKQLSIDFLDIDSGLPLPDMLAALARILCTRNSVRWQADASPHVSAAYKWHTLRSNQ